MSVFDPESKRKAAAAAASAARPEKEAAAAEEAPSKIDTSNLSLTVAATVAYLDFEGKAISSFGGGVVVVVVF